MPSLQHAVRKAVTSASGTSFWRFYTITSSTITTTAQNLTTAATGRLFVKQIIVKTDSTGLAGGTNFQILSNNAKGVVNIAVETVANLGANATRVLTTLPPAADTTTSDGVFSVTALPTILESGKRIQYSNTSAVGTGAGTIDIAIQFERVDDNATIT